MWAPFRWLQRVRTRLPFKPRRRAPTAELIASFVDIAQAVTVATPEEQQIIRAGRRSPSVVDQIGAAILARLVLARGMKLPELVRYVQHLQNRYLSAVGASAYARYAAGAPSDVFTDEDKLRAELQTLSYRLRLAYAVSHTRDHELSNIRTWCFWFLLAAFGFVLCAVAWQDYYQTSRPLLNYAIVAMIGFGGALTSIARRADKILSTGPLSEDPVIQASALDQGRASLFVAGLTGPIFALILLLLFMTDAFSVGGLTPKFTGRECQGACAMMDFRVFQFQFSLQGAIDGAKLGLWAFIAGFAEQFVPDVLDRFTKVSDRKA